MRILVSGADVVGAWVWKCCAWSMVHARREGAASCVSLVRSSRCSNEGGHPEGNPYQKPDKEDLDLLGAQARSDVDGRIDPRRR